MTPRRVNVFTISPGTPFLARFVDALKAGDIVPQFPSPTDPLALSSATILVPTQRAAQVLRETFIAQAGDTSSVLPRIRTFAQLSDIDSEPEEPGDILDELLPSGVSVMERRLVLMRFVMQWARTIQKTSNTDDDPSAIALVAAAPAHAYRLAGDLAALIDEMAIEGVPWESLTKVAPDEFDKYWQLTLSFLKIATEGWRSYLEAGGLIDRVARQTLLVDSQIARLQDPWGGPVVAIGSTGTNKATARLLKALAYSSRGAIVLPGLDLELDTVAWTLIGGNPGLGIEGSAGHPQAALFRLLKELDLSREDVIELGNPTTALKARTSFLTQALRPADTTDVWAAQRAERIPEDLDVALSGMRLIEAEDEREEALALAIAMRQVLETPGQTALLITPDRGLATRVRADLDRWQIEIDDSAGEPLRLTPLGSIARLMLDLARRPIEVMPLLALVAHPSLRLGRSAESVRHLSHLIEIGIARALLPSCQTLVELMRAARKASKTRDAHESRKAISDTEWDDLECFADNLDQALAPLHTLSGRGALDQWVAAHRASFECLTASSDEVLPQEHHLIIRLFENWARPESAGIELGAYDYSVLIDQALTEEVVRQVRPSHPRLQILGLLEARLVRADVVLLGGLDETIWPPQSQAGAFLNRPMRAQLGLTSPERRIGQTAHDFVQALGATHVVMSRARKRGGAPTVTSRLLQRMEALAGSHWSDVRNRGDELLHLTRVFELPRPEHATRGGDRPLPRPPLALRPMQLSVTRVEVLRRDPYSIYAERILRLKPLDPVGPEAGVREAGIILHDLISTFSNGIHGPVPPDANQVMLSMARDAFAEFLMSPEFRIFQWPRIETELSAYVDWERARRGRISSLYLEQSGRLALRLSDGSIFELTAQADRIEKHTDETIIVIDFKSGRVPTAREIGAGFAPQLVLEAEMLARGAFTDVDLTGVTDAIYIKLGGDDGLKESFVGSSKMPLRDLMPEQIDGLRSLIEQFRDPDTAYVSRPFPQFVSRYGRYDHLARVKEWTTSIGEG